MTVAFDCETGLIFPGRAAPALACVSVAQGSGSVLLDPEPGCDVIATVLAGDALIVGANVAYDFGVLVAHRPALLGPVFRAYEQGRVRDVQIRQRLRDIAAGELEFHWEGSQRVKTEHSLAALAQRYLGRTLNKGKRLELSWSDFAPFPADTWAARAADIARQRRADVRYRYGDLLGVPVASWGDEQRAYALDDAITTLDVFRAQGTDPVTNEQDSAYDAWALHLMRVWGVRTDANAVEALRAQLETERAELIAQLAGTGFLRQAGDFEEVRDEKPPRSRVWVQTPDGRWGKPLAADRIGTRNTDAIRAHVERVFRARGFEPPRTAPTDRFPDGQISTDADTITESGDEALATLGKLGKVEKVQSVWLESLEQGTRAPICADWRVLVESYRTSCAGPPLQQPHRKGGLRGCFVPRPGFLYASADLDSAEMRAWAQVCLEELGASRLAEFYQANPDGDPHLKLAAEKLIGITYEQGLALMGADDATVLARRQFAKIPNFGLMGGMGADSFVFYARGYGVRLCLVRGIAAQCSEQMQLTARGDAMVCSACHRAALTTISEWAELWEEAEPFFAMVKRRLGNNRRGTYYDPVTKHTRGDVGYNDFCNGFFQTRIAFVKKAAMRRAAFECYVDTASPLYGSRPVMDIHDQLVLEAPEDRAHGAAVRLGELMLDAGRRYLPDVPVRTSPLLMRRWEKDAKPRWVEGRLVPWVDARRAA